MAKKIPSYIFETAKQHLNEIKEITKKWTDALAYPSPASSIMIDVEGAAQTAATVIKIATTRNSNLVGMMELRKH